VNLFIGTRLAAAAGVLAGVFLRLLRLRQYQHEPAGAVPGIRQYAAGWHHPGPVTFDTGYVPQGTWWRVGFLLSLVPVAVWLVARLAWWKVLGLW
jgi:hypothetical protein